MGKTNGSNPLATYSVDNYDEYNIEEKRTDKKKFYKSWNCCQRCMFISAIVLCGVLLLLFILIWVVLPLVFMNSIFLQRLGMYVNVQDPANPEFDNPQKYGLEGVVNVYFTINNTEDSSPLNIGVWLIVPENEINSTKLKPADNQTARDLLDKTSYPIAIYVHGAQANRIKAVNRYLVLRKHFLIIAADFRGYGDSFPELLPSEDGIASDFVELFKWIRSKTNNDIYIWGHSLGVALSTLGLRKLKESYNMVPMGHIMEAGFTTYREFMEKSELTCLWAWLPWFEATALKPMEENGFLLRTIDHIIYVDCPIMLIHAEDDGTVAISVGQALAEFAATKRTIPPQGNVTYHQFDGARGYNHLGMMNAPEIPQYIEEFIGICKDQNKAKNGKFNNISNAIDKNDSAVKARPNTVMIHVQNQDNHTVTNGLNIVTKNITFTDLHDLNIKKKNNTVTNLSNNVMIYDQHQNKNSTFTNSFMNHQQNQNKNNTVTNSSNNNAIGEQNQDNNTVSNRPTNALSNLFELFKPPKLSNNVTIYDQHQNKNSAITNSSNYITVHDQNQNKNSTFTNSFTIHEQNQNKNSTVTNSSNNNTIGEQYQDNNKTV